jgi:outer membrane protein TolC
MRKTEFNYWCLFRQSRFLTAIILILLFSDSLYSQKILTLKECYERAMITNAIAGEKKTYSEISALKISNLSKGWLPTLDANGSIIYNSSVVDMGSVLGSLPLQGIANAIKPLPHEQYKITVDINQVIYDGGTIKGTKALEKTDLNINEKQAEADLYKLRGQINSCYFNLLLMSRQKELLINYRELIMKRISSMQSALYNGVIIMSDIDVLTAEKLKLEQQLTENEIKNESFLKILSELTGTNIDNSTELVLPAQKVELSNELSRPELQLFDLRKEQLSAGMKVIESKRMPKAFGFATLGYGNPPGSNFFKDQFAPFYILGAAVKWNIFDWNRIKNEKQLIILQQGIIGNRKKDLADNLNRLLESKNSEIASLKAYTETDLQLIALRKRITASAESQYENGIITATEYLNEMNTERLALINYEIHKISLCMAKIDYLNISGKEIE